MICTPRPAFAQMDGGSGNSVDLETEDLDEDDHSAAEPTPGTLDAPQTSAPSTSSPDSPSGMIFDWRKYKDAKEVPHPFVEKGLIRIDKNRNYIYRVDESEQKTAAAVRFGFYKPENLANPDGGANSTFDENYDQTDSPAILVDWEWQLWQSAIGKFGLTLGSGLYVAQGNGHFAGTKNPGKVPREIFTFALVPVDIGVVYRLHVWHRQLLVPYATAGGSLFGFTEIRDDNKGPKFGGSFGAYYAVGGALNLTYFDSISRIQLDREYGINAIYLTGEFRGIVALSKRFDFSGNMVNAGFLMEY